MSPCSMGGSVDFDHTNCQNSTASDFHTVIRSGCTPSSSRHGSPSRNKSKLLNDSLVRIMERRIQRAHQHHQQQQSCSLTPPAVFPPSNEDNNNNCTKEQGGNNHDNLQSVIQWNDPKQSQAQHQQQQHQSPSLYDIQLFIVVSRGASAILTKNTLSSPRSGFETFNSTDDDSIFTSNNQKPSKLNKRKRQRHKKHNSQNSFFLNDTITAFDEMIIPALITDQRWDKLAHIFYPLFPHPHCSEQKLIRLLRTAIEGGTPPEVISALAELCRDGYSVPCCPLSPSLISQGSSWFAADEEDEDDIISHRQRMSHIETSGSLEDVIQKRSYTTGDTRDADGITNERLFHRYTPQAVLSRPLIILRHFLFPQTKITSYNPPTRGGKRATVLILWAVIRAKDPSFRKVPFSLAVETLAHYILACEVNAQQYATIDKYAAVDRYTSIDNCAVLNRGTENEVAGYLAELLEGGGDERDSEVCVVQFWDEVCELEYDVCHRLTGTSCSTSEEDGCRNEEKIKEIPEEDASMKVADDDQSDDSSLDRYACPLEYEMDQPIEDRYLASSEKIQSQVVILGKNLVVGLSPYNLNHEISDDPPTTSTTADEDNADTDNEDNADTANKNEHSPQCDIGIEASLWRKKEQPASTLSSDYVLHGYSIYNLSNDSDCEDSFPRPGSYEQWIRRRYYGDDKYRSDCDDSDDDSCRVTIGRDEDGHRYADDQSEHTVSSWVKYKKKLSKLFSLLDNDSDDDTAGGNTYNTCDTEQRRHKRRLRKERELLIAERIWGVIDGVALSAGPNPLRWEATDIHHSIRDHDEWRKRRRRTNGTNNASTSAPPSSLLEWFVPKDGDDDLISPFSCGSSLSPSPQFKERVFERVYNDVEAFISWLGLFGMAEAEHYDDYEHQVSDAFYGCRAGQYMQFEDNYSDLVDDDRTGTSCNSPTHGRSPRRRRRRRHDKKDDDTAPTDLGMSFSSSSSNFTGETGYSADSEGYNDWDWETEKEREMMVMKEVWDCLRDTVTCTKPVLENDPRESTMKMRFMDSYDYARSYSGSDSYYSDEYYSDEYYSDEYYSDDYIKERKFRKERECDEVAAGATVKISRNCDLDMAATQEETESQHTTDDTADPQDTKNAKATKDQEQSKNELSHERLRDLLSCLTCTILNPEGKIAGSLTLNRTNGGITINLKNPDGTNMDSSFLNNKDAAGDTANPQSSPPPSPITVNDPCTSSSNPNAPCTPPHSQRTSNPQGEMTDKNHPTSPRKRPRHRRTPTPPHRRRPSNISSFPVGGEETADFTWNEGAEVISSCIAAAAQLIEQRLASSVVVITDEPQGEEGNDSGEPQQLLLSQSASQPGDVTMYVERPPEDGSTVSSFVPTMILKNGTAEAFSESLEASLSHVAQLEAMGTTAHQSSSAGTTTKTTLSQENLDTLSEEMACQPSLSRTTSPTASTTTITQKSDISTLFILPTYTKGVAKAAENFRANTKAVTFGFREAATNVVYDLCDKFEEAELAEKIIPNKDGRDLVVATGKVALASLGASQIVQEALYQTTKRAAKNGCYMTAKMAREHFGESAEAVVLDTGKALGNTARALHIMTMVGSPQSVVASVAKNTGKRRVKTVYYNKATGETTTESVVVGGGTAEGLSPPLSPTSQAGVAVSECSLSPQGRDDSKQKTRRLFPRASSQRTVSRTMSRRSLKRSPSTANNLESSIQRDVTPPLPERENQKPAETSSSSKSPRGVEDLGLPPAMHPLTMEGEVVNEVKQRQSSLILETPHTIGGNVETSDSVDLPLVSMSSSSRSSPSPPPLQRQTPYDAVRQAAASLLLPKPRFDDCGGDSSQDGFTRQLPELELRQSCSPLPEVSLKDVAVFANKASNLEPRGTQEQQKEIIPLLTPLPVPSSLLEVDKQLLHSAAVMEEVKRLIKSKAISRQNGGAVKNETENGSCRTSIASTEDILEEVDRAIRAGLATSVRKME